MSVQRHGPDRLWDAATAALVAIHDRDWDRAEAALLQALGQVRKQQGGTK